MPNAQLPYVPGIIPSTIDTEVSRFLNDELIRIARAMIGVSVQTAYGGISLVNGPAPPQPLGLTPEKIIGFDTNNPEVPNRVIPNAADDSLTITEEGVYFTYVNVTATVEQLTEYRLTVYVNDQPTPSFSQIETSNSANTVTFTIGAFGAVQAGDVATVWGQSDGAAKDFTMLSANWLAFRVSGLEQVG
jgi:hypothetical protein